VALHFFSGRLIDPFAGDVRMNTNEFLRDQYLALRDEIRESKAHIFWLLVAGMVLVLVAGYMAAEHPSAFANAAIPFLLLALMLAYISEQNNIARAGRYLREIVEPRIQDLTCWEHWLESKHQFREVDHAFVIGFSMIFLVFFAISTSLTLWQLVLRGQEWYVWSVGTAYVLGGICVMYVFVRHYRASTAVS
jgi:uncharacterized membrane protein YfcA